MREATSGRGATGFSSQLVALAGLLLVLAAPAAAQSLQAGCPGTPEPPAFVAGTVHELAALKPHAERWREPLQWQQLLRELDQIRWDGLLPQNYLVADLARIADQLSGGLAPTPCQSALASLALVWSLSDLQWGRLDPEELGFLWHQTSQRPDPGKHALSIHRDFAHHRGLPQAYRKARPALESYRKLRGAYRTLVHRMPESWPTVPAGPVIRQGDVSLRVTALADRLVAQGYLASHQPWAPQPTTQVGTEPGPEFDGALTRAVMAFQRDHGLNVDGLVGPETVQTLNVPPGVWLARTRANLERLRWIAPYFADDMVLVDIAGARVHLFRDGREHWRGNAQVGRPGRMTPALTSFISHITVNPTWTIPPTIFYEDTLPAIQADPDYLTRNRLTVMDRSGTALDPDHVDWSNPGRLMLRQAAGPGNALGEVVIRFPNPFAVYLHDTPSRQLFDTPDRFYSSGCVRVENAPHLADRLFREAPEVSWQQIRESRHSGETRNVSLPHRTRLVMAYWTAEAGTGNRVRFRPDTYQEDRRLIDLLEAKP